MENRKTIGYLNGKRWYKALKVLHILFVVFCYLVVIMAYAVIFTDGTDGINIFLKIVSIPVLIFFAWIIGSTPQQVFYYIMNIEGFDSYYSKIKLVAGVFFIGLIGIFAVVVIFPIGNHKAITVTGTITAGSQQFIQTLSELTNTPIEQGGTVTPIVDGNEFLPILLNALNTASSSIDFTTFPWADGTFNDQVFTALRNAANRGVQVRLLLDAFGSHSLSKNYIRDLQAAGGKVAEYHPFNLSNPLQYDSRDHIRSMVIDGKVGFTGGMGITDEWFGSAPDNTFEDMMFEFKGNMAQSLQGSFAQVWNDTTGEVLSGPLFYPLLSNMQTTNYFIGITSVPSGDYEPVRDAFLLTALSAQKKLYIVASYIIPDQALLKVLEDKARSGVDVRIVSPGGITVAPILRAVWHLDYDQLLAAGVKIYEYQPSMIHTKFMVSDDIWSLIGSANIDNRSEALNAENIMGISDQTLASSLDGTFMDYLSRSKEITLADWENQYGFFSRLYSRMLLVLAKQY
jgi:cardiolipin synthase